MKLILAHKLSECLSFLSFMSWNHKDSEDRDLWDEASQKLSAKELASLFSSMVTEQTREQNTNLPYSEFLP